MTSLSCADVLAGRAPDGAPVTIKGRKDCRKRGYGQAGFFEIDTGNYTTWVQNLSD